MPDAKQNPASNKSEGIEVYFLAARQDEAICKALKKHLNPVIDYSSTPIILYDDFEIPPGQDINRYKEKLYESEIVIALISVDFLNNETYRRTQKVIERFNAQKTILFPILVRNCMWKSTPFVNLQLLPKNLQPVNNKQFWNSEDDALTVVATEIYNAILAFNKTSESKAPTEINAHWRWRYYLKTVRKRATAIFLDTLLSIPIFGIIAFLTTWIGILIAGLKLKPSEDFSDSMLYYSMPTLVFIVFLAILESSKWQATFGKRIMKMQTTDLAGNRISLLRALWRNLLKILLGNLWIVWLVKICYDGFRLLRPDFNDIVFNYYFFFALWAIPLAIQLVHYFIAGKFLHDRWSGTVVGERLAR